MPRAILIKLTSENDGNLKKSVYFEAFEGNLIRTAPDTPKSISSVLLDVGFQYIPGEFETPNHFLPAPFKATIFVLYDDGTVVSDLVERGKKAGPIHIAKTWNPRHLPAHPRGKNPTLIQPFFVYAEILGMHVCKTRTEFADKSILAVLPSCLSLDARLRGGCFLKRSFLQCSRTTGRGHLPWRVARSGLRVCICGDERVCLSDRGLTGSAVLGGAI